MRTTLFAAAACLLLGTGGAMAKHGSDDRGGDDSRAAPLPLPVAGALGSALFTGALGLLGFARTRRLEDQA